MPLKLQLQPSILMALGAGCVMAVSLWLLFTGQTTALTAGVALCVLFVAFRKSRRLGIYLALAFLILLGDIRRISGLVNGFAPNDLLLLVGPIFIALVTIPLFVRIRLKDTPSKLVFALMIIMLLGVFNPAQGGVVVGFAGLLFWLAPLLWFWVGRTYGSEAVIQTIGYRILIPAALLACMLGLYQTFAGPAPWQKVWVEHSLSNGFFMAQFGRGGVRPFGFSTATSEYTAFILIASLFCLVGALAGRRALFLPLVVLLPTLFLASERNAIFRLLIGAAIGYTFKSRNAKTLPFRMAFALLVGFGGLSFALSQHGDIAVGRGEESTAQMSLSHQVNGLAHPFNDKYSDASAHEAEIFGGFIAAFKHPIGFGTGSSTIASTKFSDSGGGGASEFDISDMFLSLGIPGGLTFISIIVSMLLTGYRYTRFGPKDISLAIFAMMFAFTGSWFFQGEYGNGPVFFMLLGSMVRIVHQAEQSQAFQALGRIAASRTERPRLREALIARSGVRASTAE